MLEKGRELQDQGAHAETLWIYCMAFAGDLEGALDGLEAVLRLDPTGIIPVWNPDPPWAAIRETDRFTRLLADAGLVDLYEVRGWPDLCRSTGLKKLACE